MKSRGYRSLRELDDVLLRIGLPFLNDIKDILLHDIPIELIHVFFIHRVILALNHLESDLEGHQSVLLELAGQ